MKKWHLETVLCRITSPKLILPDPGHTAYATYTPAALVEKEPRLVSMCRSVVAFFIRFF